MHPFQENLQTWFSRKLSARTTNQCIEIPFILSSDIGLVRKENQDRVAALYTGKKSTNTLFAIAVADGMGGMRDGGECATLALSSFFYALIQHRNLDLKERASEAIKASNNQVFDIYKGDGGSTLTAVLVDSRGEKIFVHLGDSRIYTFGFNKKTERHTTDDSLAEAVGGTGRELLQFVGMDHSMQPKIADFSHAEGFCAITTDGIHSIEEKTLNKIFENSTDIKQASERLNAISRWCGGHDNSTSAIFDLGEILTMLERYESNGIRLWDAGGDLTTLWLREEDQAFNVKHDRIPRNRDEEKNSSSSPAPNASMEASSPKKLRPPTKRSRKKKQESSHSEKIQLDIEIGNSEEQGKMDADSK